MSVIERNRRELGTRPVVRTWASPAIRGLDHCINDMVARYATGRTLDVGCGAMPYRDRILRTADSYDGLDAEVRHPDVRYVASATDMSPVEDASYDTVLCSEVLEHVDDPVLALREIARVVRPGGQVILSVPFLGRLHEEPYDFARYTEHGLRKLCGDVGLEIEAVEVTGSVASFVGHQISTVLVGATWHVPVLKWLSLATNAVAIVAPCRLVDKLLGPARRKLPLGYVVLARPAH